jgi:hypothetical protein
MLTNHMNLTRGNLVSEYLVQDPNAASAQLSATSTYSEPRTRIALFAGADAHR